MKQIATRNFSNLGFGLSIVVMIIVVVFAAINLRALKRNNIGNKVVGLRDGAEAMDFLFCTGGFADRDRTICLSLSCWI